jgi:hypothetical protein
MTELKFKATNTKTGETVIFTFNDLYGYEGEVCGVIIRDTDIVLVYNEHSSECERGGVNPDLKIELFTEE